MSDDELCRYVGIDSTATIQGAGAEGATSAWMSRCHCGTVTLDAGTYDAARRALDEHRGFPVDDEEPEPEPNPDGPAPRTVTPPAPAD